jgi:hypothetical protein
VGKKQEKWGRGYDARGSGRKRHNKRQEQRMWGNRRVRIKVIDGRDGFAMEGGIHDGQDGLAMEGGVHVAWIRA